MNFGAAFNRARISRVLVSVLVLTFLQTIGGPILAPNIVAPKAKAVEVTYASATGGLDFVIPAGVFSITLTARGGAGGSGGKDASALGLASSNVGSVAGTFSVSPGDRITLYPGGAGGAGGDDKQNVGAGSAGAASIPTFSNTITPSVRFNGTWSSVAYVNGGFGGAAGSVGTSGAGGGGGAASIILINENVALVAAGGGGGAGGSGPGAAAWSGTYASSGSAKGSDGAYGGGCGNSDGGGGGGGGGGWQGGAGGSADRPTGGECRGFGGSPGANFVWNAITPTTNSFISPSGAGTTTYVLNYSAVTTCSTDVQTVDIYTVVKVINTLECTWSVPSTVSVIDLFIVGGGAGGAGDGGGGGGGGAALSRTAISVTPSSTMNLKVGYGGAASAWGFTSNAYAGDSTTVRTASGTVFSALGGSSSANGNAPGGAGGLGGVASNGGFSGGAGGVGGASVGASGGAAKTGISNYFYGTQNTYAGGGGGGSYPNGAVITAAPGANGGGAGGYASSASVNQPGTNATDNSGSGGGGGTAVGTGLRLIGGKGGSGVIIIRYATSSANEFPASVASALVKRFLPGDLQTLDSSRKGWIDSSGQNAAVAHGNFTGTPTVVNQGTTDSGYTVASSKTLLTAAGTTSDRVVLSDLPNNYTLFHVARYQRGGSQGRLISATGNNWLSGFYSGQQGVAFHNTGQFMTPQPTTDYTWQLSTDKTNLYRSNGKDVTYNVDAFGTPSTGTGFGINVGWSGAEYSTWQVADLLVFNRELTNGETRLVELYLSRIYGLTLDSEYTSSDTDTSISLTGSQYLYSQKSVSNYLNDTFTVESWVNPSTNCSATGSNSCAIFARENVLLTRIYQGRFWYALFGTAVGWEWYDTTVQVPSNEWHHVTITKRLAGGAANSLDVYLDGQLVWTKVGSPYRTGAASGSASEVVYQENNAWTYIGIRGAYNTDQYYGKIDEIKVWKVARTASQIASDMHSNDASSPLLQLYYDFNKSTLSSSNTVINLAYGGPIRADLVAATTITYADVKTVSSSGPYTTVTFPRTYITQSGGWKVPTGVARASALVVAGGGGGGSRHGGGGGGGGVSYSPTYVLNSGATYEIKVGTGGFGYGQPGNNPYVDASNLPVTSAGNNANGSGTSGGNSTFKSSNVLESITALGGGGGGGTGLSGGSGGGSNSGVAYTTVPEKTQYSTSYFVGYGNKGGQGYNGSSCGTDWCGGGGGGAGSAGGIPTTSGSTQAGNGGNGFAVAVESLSPTYYGGGGGGGSYNPTLDSTGGLGGGGAGGKNAPGANGTYALGGGGGGGGFAGGTSYRGGNGGTGLIALRWIAASVPTYTKPTNAYLNVGMTETFTTNVAVDSATAQLTRTFLWESSTAGAGGPFTRIKSGTGAANASFSWIPSDTSTSGSNYLYRLTVTDSDTAGLFITDSSTAFAVINRTLLMSGATTINKTINVTRNENYTISQGTPGYRYTLSPAISGITMDTTTVGTTILRIADTATVGTYSQTLTVTDSVTGTVVLPITIVISAPPTLNNFGEIVTSGQVFNIDSGNSASYTPGSTASGNSAIRDISGGKKTVSINGSALSYSDDFSGILTFSTANSNFLNFTKDSRLTAWTLEAYIRLDSTLSAGSCIFANQYSGSNLNYALCLDSSRTFYTGFVVNGAWTYKRTSTVLPVGSWFHLVGTFDPTGGIQLYLDGATPAISENYTSAGLSTPLTGLDNVYIGRYFDSAYNYFMPMSIGALRIYNRALTSAEVTQNMNATKARFQTAKVNKIKSTQKYGSLNIDSFTVSAGGDTKTVSFQVGSRTGITWDTSTAGVVNLSVLSSLPVGTYYDTVTVTDNLSSSTYLPIKFTVTKADTITVTTTLSSNSVTYNELPANVTLTQSVAGLVNSETLTATNTFTVTTCEYGGTCAIGDVAPGGGHVFYVSPTIINVATGISSGGIYLATAPQTWSGAAADPNASWGCSGTNISGTSTSVGSGAENTRLINAGCATAGIASRLAADSSAEGFTDWFIPSIGELNLIRSNLKVNSLSNLNGTNYWSSSQDSTNPTTSAQYQWFTGGTSGPTDKNNSAGSNMHVRPIRAFSPTAVASNTIPTDAGTYRVGASYSLSSPALLSNYQGIESVTATLTINKARQRTITIGQYQAFPNISSYPLNVYGGSGSGILTRTLVSAGTAGCSLAATSILTATSVGTCTVKAEKAGTRNYIVESTTATISWVAWVDNYVAQTLGGNHAIPLSGGNQIIVRTETLTASAFSNETGTAISSARVGTKLRINSTGFSGLTPSSLTVTFRPYEDAVINAVTSTYVEVVIPSGAVTGVIAIDSSSRGVAYTQSFTISP